MKKAFALIPGLLPEEELFDDVNCAYEDYNNPITVEVFAIVSRDDERLIALHRHEEADYWPMSLEQLAATDSEGMVEIFISSHFHQISEPDFKENYVWSTIVHDNYKIRDASNQDNLASMKGEIMI
ncbi:hypothetical protein_gp253 [Bacillus phage vB_BceM_WH1]|nr:hypothetical protein_gp253 [Bacillus phage vB_BceM_WH1]